MGKITTFIATTVFIGTIGMSAFAASPDVYVVNFKNSKDANSQNLDRHLYPALDMLSGNIEHVIIDTSTAAKWEKGAHEAFDRDIVPVFNKWVGLPGFAAVVNARTKKVIGCLNPQFSMREMAQELQRMEAQAKGVASMSQTSFAKTTECPSPFNTPPQ